MKTSEILQNVLDIGKYLESNPPKPMSNADRIRSMTDDEMAGFMFRTFGKTAWCLDNKCPPEESCDQCWLDWLKQESEGDQ